MQDNQVGTQRSKCRRELWELFPELEISINQCQPHSHPNQIWTEIYMLVGSHWGT